METKTNLKRRRESGEGSAKKIYPNTPPQHDPLEGTSTMVPQAPLFPSPEKHHPSPQKQPSSPQQQKSPPHAPSLPSLTLSSFFSPELFPLKKKVNRFQSEARPPLPPPPKSQQIRRRTKPVSPEKKISTFEKAAALCAIDPEAIRDFQLKKTLKQLLDLERVNNKMVANPMNFRNAPMVTTFVRAVGSRTQDVWKFLEEASQLDADVRLAELQHSSFKKLFVKCSGRAPICAHPSFCRSLKVRFPLDVGGLSKDGRVTTELGTGSLRQAVGILTSEDFQPVVDTKLVSGSRWL